MAGPPACVHVQVCYSLGAFIRHAMATYMLTPALDSALARRQRLRALLAHAAMDYDTGIDWVRPSMEAHRHAGAHVHTHHPSIGCGS